MKAKELISFLESFEENAEVEIEVCDSNSGKCFDSTFDIGLQDEPDHPTLVISTERSSS